MNTEEIRNALDAIAYQLERIAEEVRAIALEKNKTTMDKESPPPLPLEQAWQFRPGDYGGRLE